MKKSSKKMQLKKRSISRLNAKQATGGVGPISTVNTIISILCLTAIYAGEDLCLSVQEPLKHQQRK
ncbi:MAG: hypothetical protein AAF611_10945 [Bacteroidota bacterium]